MDIDLVEKLDKMVDILYDKKYLHWKQTKVTDIISIKKDEYGLSSWTDAEVNFVISKLAQDGYIKEEQEQNLEITCSLTIQGIIKKRTGGFKADKQKEDNTKLLIKIGQFAAIIAGIYYLFGIFEQIYSFLKLILCYD